MAASKFQGLLNACLTTVKTLLAYIVVQQACEGSF